MPLSEAERGLDRSAIRQPSCTLSNQRIRQSSQPLGGLIQPISAKAGIESQGRRRPVGQRFQSLGLFAQVPARVAKRLKRLAIVVADRPADFAAQGEYHHQGSLHFPAAGLELADGRHQALADPQADEDRCQGRGTGKIRSRVNASWHCHQRGCGGDRLQHQASVATATSRRGRQSFPLWPQASRPERKSTVALGKRCPVSGFLAAFALALGRRNPQTRISGAMFRHAADCPGY